MSTMNELIKCTSLKSENGDATSTYDCELARNNITVREFAEAVENSVHNRGQEFNEWWATVSMAIVGHSWIPHAAQARHGRADDRTDARKAGLVKWA